MNTNSLYMDEILSELTGLTNSAIEKIHDSAATGISLPKLSISDTVLTTNLIEQWKNEFHL